MHLLLEGIYSTNCLVCYAFCAAISYSLKSRENSKFGQNSVVQLTNDRRVECGKWLQVWAAKCVHSCAITFDHTIPTKQFVVEQNGHRKIKKFNE